jgi:hypothetical protein
LVIFIPINFGAFFVAVENEPDGIDTECSEVVDVFGTLRLDFESFVGVASGREGSTEFGFEEREEPDCAGPTGGGLDGSEGWRDDDDLEKPSC